MCWEADPKTLWTSKLMEGAAPSLAQNKEKSGFDSVPKASPQKQASQTSGQWDKCVEQTRSIGQWVSFREGRGHLLDHVPTPRPAAFL